MTVDLSGLASSFSTLAPVRFDYIDYVALGNVLPVSAGGYMARLGQVALPSPFGQLNDVWVAFATSDLLSEVQLPSSGPLVLPRRGISLYFESSPLPYMCDAPLLFSLLVQPSPLLLAVRGRCLDLAFDLRLVDRYDSYQQNLLLLPTINFISLTGIEMSIEIQTGGTSGSLSFSVAATFQMETGALSSSYCAPATDGTASASTQCLRAQITATAASLTLPTGPATSLTLQLDTVGLWLEPLGLRNFAVADPSFGLGAQVFTCPSPIGFCASPQLLSWNILVAYKKSGLWPARMNTFSSWDGPSGHCTLPPQTATCYTPCVCLLTKSHRPRTGSLVDLHPNIDRTMCTALCRSWTEDSNVLVGWTSLLFQMAPSSDPLLSRLGLPVFGFRIQIPSMTLTNAVSMLADIYSSVLAGFNSDAYAETPTCTSSSPANIYAPTCIPSEIKLSTFDAGTQVDQHAHSLYSTMCCMHTNSTVLTTTGQLRVAPPVSLVSFIDDMWPFEFDNFTAEVSLVHQGVFRRGIYLSFGTRTKRPIAGFEFEIRGLADMQQDEPWTIFTIAAFIANPLDGLRTMGIVLHASAAMPWELGNVEFEGRVTSTTFALAGSGSMSFLYPASLDVFLAVQFVALPTPAARISAAATVALGPFGDVRVAGTLSRSTSGVASYSLTGSFCWAIGALSMQAQASADSATQTFSVTLSATLGFLAQIDLTGDVTSSSVALQVRLKPWDVCL